MANSRICSIPECGKNNYSKDYCKSHYMRLWRHGDPIGGRTPHGEPMRFISEVVLLHTSDECLIWPFANSGKGYGKIWIDGKKATANRYVCELVNGPPPTPDHESAHSCGRGHIGCISPKHLSWKTSAENKADKLIHGTHSRGERNYGAKITEAEARQILALKGKEKQVDLAERFAVSPSLISHIHAGRTWAWLSEEVAA